VNLAAHSTGRLWPLARPSEEVASTVQVVRHGSRSTSLLRFRREHSLLLSTRHCAVLQLDITKTLDHSKGTCSFGACAHRSRPRGKRDIGVSSACACRWRCQSNLYIRFFGGYVCRYCSHDICGTDLFGNRADRFQHPCSPHIAFGGVYAYRCPTRCILCNRCFCACAGT